MNKKPAIAAPAAKKAPKPAVATAVAKPVPKGIPVKAVATKKAGKK
ncbi:MAG: hypothetical protein IPM06_18565 [Rhizobiales bacterium]|nr:hypothetical protein [Hyphomicrobiales bacterium]